MESTNPSNISPGAGGDNVKSFRCADVGNPDCRWKAVGRTEDELRPQIERHGREEHGIKELLLTRHAVSLMRDHMLPKMANL